MNEKKFHIQNMGVFLLCVKLVYLLCYFPLLSTSSSDHHLCHVDEGHALLKFKQNLIVSIDASAACDFNGHSSRPKIMSWNQSSDCCNWDGVFCNQFTGDVIGLDLSCSQLKGVIHPNSRIFKLTKIRMINLAYNDFSGSRIPSEISSFTSLTHLNLSNSFFSGHFPPEISGLSNLISLDLSSSFPTSWRIYFEGESFTRLLQNLTKLELLFLDHANISTWTGVEVGVSSSLKRLSLYQTELHGQLPGTLFHLPNLQMLELGGNNNLTGTLPEFNQTGVQSLKWFSIHGTAISGAVPNSIGYMKSLNHLEIQGCNLSGTIPASIGNITQLIHMDFSNNHFHGSVPSTLSHLNQLVYLNLSSNSFDGQIPDVFANFQRLSTLHLGFNNLTGNFPGSIVNISRLEFLSLSQNSVSGPLPSNASKLQMLKEIYLQSNLFNGSIPSWLLHHPTLAVLVLSYNHFNGIIDDFKSETLEYVYMSNNQLHGHVPRSIAALANLKGLDLAWNNLTDVLEMGIFSNLSKLVALDVSYNSLQLSMNNYDHLNFPHLSSFSMASCQLQDFPVFLRNSENLTFLDLSDNNIHGEIPNWFCNQWTDTLYHLNLSHNFLTGFGQLHWKNMQFLHLQSNMFQGPFPLSICHLNVLHVLNMDDNELTGVLPKCLGTFSNQLSVVDLRRNSFSGSIPEFADDSNVRKIGLNSNKLQGPVPRSLINCTNLEVLDIGNNNIDDAFPWWLETLPELQALILKSNRFHGSASTSIAKYPFPKVRIFDLSNNGFTGLLPAKFLKNFKAIMNTDAHGTKVSYMGDYIDPADSFSIVLKGLEVELPRVSKMCTNIDLSSNKFEGEIPTFIGNLNSLVLLNLSHNMLSGHIPSEIKNMSRLESLDLSCNHLEGEIPVELTRLTYLEVLNLSQNHLVGRIPRGNQFNTFQINSYTGNPGLCGFPLLKECNDDKDKQTSESEADDEQDFVDGFTWRAVLMGYGFGILLGFSKGYLMFQTGKLNWFIEEVEKRLHRPTKNNSIKMKQNSIPYPQFSS